MSLFEKTVGLLRLGGVFLVLSFKLLPFQLSLVIIKSFITLLSIDQLIVEVFKPAQVGNDATFVFLLASLLKRVTTDFENLKVIAQAV